MHDTSQLRSPTSNPYATLQGSEKARYVRGMFARISGRYDLMNRLMSFGQDGVWRRKTVAAARPRQGGLSLDVATGTGRIAHLLATRGTTAVGLDFTLEMMLAGRAAGMGSTGDVYFVAGDAQRLPFADATFDCVTTGFAMRNVSDMALSFREMRRVVKPGGRVVCLEVGRPGLAPTRLFHALHTRAIVPALGRVVAGDSDAYTYLPSSMSKFPSPPELAAIMTAAGLRNVRFRQFTFGAAAIHVGVR